MSGNGGLNLNGAISPYRRRWRLADDRKVPGKHLTGFEGFKHGFLSLIPEGTGATADVFHVAGLGQSVACVISVTYTDFYAYAKCDDSDRVAVDRLCRRLRAACLHLTPGRLSYAPD